MRNFIFAVFFMWLFGFYINSTQAQTYYCRQFDITLTDQLYLNNEQCYQSPATVVYKGDLIIVVTDRFTITARHISAYLYVVDGHLYTFRDKRDGENRYITLMPTRFNNKFEIDNKIGIQISTKKICEDNSNR